MPLAGQLFGEAGIAFLCTDRIAVAAVALPRTTIHVFHNPADVVSAPGPAGMTTTRNLPAGLPDPVAPHGNLLHDPQTVNDVGRLLGVYAP